MSSLWRSDGRPRHNCNRAAHYHGDSSPDNIIGSGDGAPTKWTIEVVDELSRRLAEQIRQLNALVAADVAGLLKPAENR